ncbi:hypothetical protein AX16_009963 [Volvariella volvacea WC 439]|nr:hypothetical protein AX16_009963 [Volvariella volvacea WC 439]
MRFFSGNSLSLSIAALLAAASTTVTALKLSTPTNPVIGETTDIAWTSQPGDPGPWNLFLMSATQAFILYQNFGENIDPTLGKVTVKIAPHLQPRDDYILYAVNSSNWDWVFAASPRFALYAL